jgi:hypothetical protein
VTQLALRRSLSALVALALCAFGLQLGSRPALADPPCAQLGISCDYLSPSSIELMSGSTLTLTAVVGWLAPTSHLVIFNANTGATIKDCPVLPCSGTVSGNASPQTGHTTTFYNGVILNTSTGAAEEYLGSVGVRWDAFSVRLGVVPIPGVSTALLTASSNVDVGPTPFYITIYREGPSGSYTALHSCASGTMCTVGVAPSSPQNWYAAFILPYPPSNPQPWNTEEAASRGVPF